MDADQMISQGWIKEHKDVCNISWPPQEVRYAWEPSHHTQWKALHSLVGVQYYQNYTWWKNQSLCYGTKCRNIMS